MDGLSKDIDLSFLNGRELNQVAIGLYHVQSVSTKMSGFLSKVTLATLTDKGNGLGGQSQARRKLQFGL